MLSFVLSCAEDVVDFLPVQEVGKIVHRLPGAPASALRVSGAASTWGSISPGAEVGAVLDPAPQSPPQGPLLGLLPSCSRVWPPWSDPSCLEEPA